MSLTNNEAAFLRGLERALSNLESRFTSLGLEDKIPIASDEDRPGNSMPQTEGANVFITGSLALVTGQPPYLANIVFDSDGPFYAQRIHFAWKTREYDAQDPEINLNNFWYHGIFQPISSVNIFNVNYEHNEINFFWEYFVSGTRRNRQNIPVPSACVDRAETGNGAWEMFVNDVFPAGATVTVRITPLRAPEYDGVLYCAFHGCYSLH